MTRVASLLMTNLQVTLLFVIFVTGEYSHIVSGKHSVYFLPVDFTHAKTEKQISENKKRQ